MTSLTSETITFGKYKNSELNTVLKDRNYCKWLLKQEWFMQNYEYLYNKVTSYNPQTYFLKPVVKDDTFFHDYAYFNMYDPDEIELPLTESEKKCYTYYKNIIMSFKDCIEQRFIDNEENMYNIKAPVKWLQKFEKETGLSRTQFKEFINSYELPNITYIIEDIKKAGGIEYKGAQAFKIAKKNSEEQEKWWENILKNKYGEEIGTQFKFEKCIFDFIHINKNLIYECKLGIKDFNKEQYEKYMLTLNKYKILYLIDRDCIIDTEKEKIFCTSDESKYVFRKYNTEFDEILIKYTVEKIENLEDCL